MHAAKEGPDTGRWIHNLVLGMFRSMSAQGVITL